MKSLLLAIPLLLLAAGCSISSKHIKDCESACAEQGGVVSVHTTGNCVCGETRTTCFPLVTAR